MAAIAMVSAREILNSRGQPTIEVDVRLDDGAFGRASVPAGASTGRLEASELRDDGSERYGGKGVLCAVEHVNRDIAPQLRGAEACDLPCIDELLVEIDGTHNKGRLGANAILGVSLAVGRAISMSVHRPLYQTLRPGTEPILPVPMFNVLNGGVHADNNVEFQEFMVVPVGTNSFREALRAGAEVYEALKTILKASGMSTAVGDEGGFAPDLASDQQAIELILKAIETAGLEPGNDVVLALDAAASTLYGADGLYALRASNAHRHSAEDMVTLYESWIRQFPIWSIEDGLAQNDWEGWQLMTRRLGERIQLVGDDVFVTNPAIIRRVVHDGVGNAALIKLNQIGTLSETLQAIETAREAHYSLLISHRSGETDDDFIADFAVATAAGQIKAGAPARGERVAKYNQLMRIEEDLSAKATFAGQRFMQAGKFCAP